MDAFYHSGHSTYKTATPRTKVVFSTKLKDKKVTSCKLQVFQRNWAIWKNEHTRIGQNEHDCKELADAYSEMSKSMK